MKPLLKVDPREREKVKPNREKPEEDEVVQHKEKSYDAGLNKIENSVFYNGPDLTLFYNINTKSPK